MLSVASLKSQDFVQSFFFGENCAKYFAESGAGTGTAT
jgi:hypothetical protein